MVKIVIDMMGGDNGYEVTMEAVKNFLTKHDDCEIIAVGDEKVLEPIKDIVAKIIPSKSILPMEGGVMQAMRQKDSSCYLAISAVNEEKADGVLSAGSTGAFLSLATLINKKIPGVERRVQPAGSVVDVVLVHADYPHPADALRAQYRDLQLHAMELG